MGKYILKKSKIAKTIQLSRNNSSFMRILTDSMAANNTIWLNYKNSGWRQVVPYGWHSSKAGNILLMCYKAAGEIRSYRIDRIDSLLVDESQVSDINEQNDYSFNDFEMPALPNMDEIIEETEKEVGEQDDPYSEGMKALSDESNIDDYLDTFEDNDDSDDISDNNEFNEINDEFDEFSSDDSFDNDSSENNSEQQDDYLDDFIEEDDKK